MAGADSAGVDARAQAGGPGAARALQAEPQRGAEPAPRPSDPPHPALFWLLAVFLVVEYVRPLAIARLRLQLLIALGLPLAWLRERDRPWSWLLSAQILFLLLCAAMAPFASNNYAAYMSTRTLYGNVAIAISMSWLLSWRAPFKRCVGIWLAIMAYLAAYSIGHAGRGPGGFIGDENDLALGCLTALPFAFYGFEWLRGWQRWLCVALGGLLLAAIVASYSRGGFVGLAAVVVYCLVVSRHRLRNFLLALAGAAAVLSLAPQSYIEEIKTIRDTRESTAEARRFLWTTATNMWLEHPLLGVGGGGFIFLAGDYQPTDPPFDKPDYLERSWSGTATHSLYFQLLAEHGIVGMAIFLSLLWVHFRTLRRLRGAARDAPAEVLRDAELYSRALAAAMLGYLAAGAFLSVPYYPYPWYFAGMALALDTAIRRELPHGGASEERSPA